MAEGGVAARNRAIVVVPTYNERPNLATLLTEITRLQPDLDVLVVDDASPDGTGALARQWAQRDGRIRVLERPAKAGLGPAYLAGFCQVLAAPEDYTHVLQMDADLSHPVASLGALRHACVHADLAVGSRWVPGGRTVNWPWRRRWVSRLGSHYARAVLGVDVRDLTSGFKCFRRRALEAVLERGVVTVGYGFQIEVTAQVLAQGFRVVEVPITFTERQQGESKLSGAIVREALVGVWRLRKTLAAGPA